MPASLTSAEESGRATWESLSVVGTSRSVAEGGWRSCLPGEQPQSDPLVLPPDGQTLGSAQS